MPTEQSDSVTLPAAWLADIRFRAERKMGLCLHEHSVHNDGGVDSLTVRVTCDGAGETLQLGSLVIPKTSHDASDEIRSFVTFTLAEHERSKAGDVVLTLLAAIEAGEGQRTAMTERTVDDGR